ncbi:hypothetical protein LNP17_12060 [Klebsiella variicola subsp. variicola]|nr:hypothetical protein [Klebsiella variicola subsp. variicola]
MLEGLVTFLPIVPFIRDHHFSPDHRGSREQHIVYFADAFERLLPAGSHVAGWPTRAVVEQFVSLHREIDPPLCDMLCEVAENANFWQHLHPGHIQRLLEIIGPINTLYLDIHGLKDICLLIAKIVDTYSSFTATHSIMVGGNRPPACPLDATAGAHLPANSDCRLSARYRQDLYPAFHPRKRGRTE